MVQRTVVMCHNLEQGAMVISTTLKKGGYAGDLDPQWIIYFISNWMSQHVEFHSDSSAVRFCVFDIVCLCVFVRSGSQALQQLPARWLSEVLEEVKSSDPSSKLCATRRSAGIPFYIQVCKHDFENVNAKNQTKEYQTGAHLYPSCFRTRPVDF